MHKHSLFTVGIFLSLLSFSVTGCNVQVADAPGASNAVAVQTSANVTPHSAIMPPSQLLSNGRSESTRAHYAAVRFPLVPYNGPIQHIFFHPLIAFPSLAFSPSDPERQGFNDWFVTVPEFDKMLAALYQRHYILIDINSLYSETTLHGKTFVQPTTLMLPKGKIPLVLSVDDMNYYPYMQQWGTIQRLVLDKQGKIAALSKFPDGHLAITYNNAIVPILDAFVRAHPDFSFEGAKGMINLTGYAGVLGYRTNDTQAADYPQVKAAALKVIARLKATGWIFASHSWGHLPDATISYATFVDDTNKWLQQVEPLTGPTQVYVYPFGSRVNTDGAKFNYLIQKGFHVFCGVGPTTYVQWTPQVLMMDRRHIDGISLHSERSTLNDLFGTEMILDPRRPNVY